MEPYHLLCKNKQTTYYYNKRKVWIFYETILTWQKKVFFSYCPKIQTFCSHLLPSTTKFQRLGSNFVGFKDVREWSFPSLDSSRRPIFFQKRNNRLSEILGYTKDIRFRVPSLYISKLQSTWLHKPLLMSYSVSHSYVFDLHHPSRLLVILESWTPWRRGDIRTSLLRQTA